jgi:hypothetical protein
MVEPVEKRIDNLTQAITALDFATSMNNYDPSVAIPKGSHCF